MVGVDDQAFDADAERVRRVYRQRQDQGLAGRYRPGRPEVVLDQTGLQLAWSRALDGGYPGADDRVLDVGCGRGSWLRRLVDSGLPPASAFGIDVIAERIEEGRQLAPPGMELRHGSGFDLPFGDGTFSLVYAHTVLSSILDPDLRGRLGHEMRRVTAPDGRLLVYDFRYPSPRNPDVVPIGTQEIRRLFPGMQVRRYTLTLLPPLNRRLARFCPWLCMLLERCLPPLRSHALYLLWNPEARRRS